MTNTNTLRFLAMIVTMGCSTPPPEKVYDFAARPLTGSVPASTSARSPKAQMRRAIDMLQPQLAGCTTGTAGELDVTLRIELATDQPPVLDGVDVAYPDPTAAACARDVLAAIDLSVIETRESSVWVVHTPFIIAAPSANL